MKKKVIIICLIICALIVSLLVFLSSKREENEIVFFKYIYGYVPSKETERVGELLKGEKFCTNTIELKNNKYQLISNYYGSDDVYGMYEVSRKDIRKLQQIIEYNNIDKWNKYNEDNFNEYKSNDKGKYFIIEITYKDGRNIKVATNINFPSNYEEVHTNIEECLKDIMKEN